MIPDYDKYAVYIWACYGLTVLLLVGLVWWSVVRARKIERELDTLDGERRRARAGS